MVCRRSGEQRCCSSSRAIPVPEEALGCCGIPELSPCLLRGPGARAVPAPWTQVGAEPVWGGVAQVSCPGAAAGRMPRMGGGSLGRRAEPQPRAERWNGAETALGLKISLVASQPHLHPQPAGGALRVLGLLLI